MNQSSASTNGGQKIHSTPFSFRDQIAFNEEVSVEHWLSRALAAFLKQIF